MAEITIAKYKSPAKIGGVGYNNPYFEMPAKYYNNSPIEKNFGTPAQRGIAAFGTKDSEGVDKISTDSDFSPFGFNSSAAVGGSPAKGIFDRIRKGISHGVKRIGKAMGLGPKEEDAAAAAQAGAAAGGAVAPHGDEAHTTAGGGQTDLATVDPNTLTDPLLRGAAAVQQGGTTGGTITKTGGVGSGVTTALGEEEEEGAAQQAVRVMSDIRVKEKIERTGKSPSGIPMYEFNYIGGSNRYSGAMAQDLLEMNIDAVSLGDDGYYRVNYNNIDVDMRQIN